MIANLPRLVYLTKKFPKTGIVKKLFERYTGDDWRNYIEYSKEIKLSPRLFLVGLNSDETYHIDTSSVIRFLEDTYIPYPTFHIYHDHHNYVHCLYQTTILEEGYKIHSKDYTSFLVWKSKKNEIVNNEEEISFEKRLIRL